MFTTDQTNQIIIEIKIELFSVFYRRAKNPSFLRLLSVAALDNFLEAVKLILHRGGAAQV